jgi:hypothetical protein
MDDLDRAYNETRDQLLTFRYDDQGIRKRIHGWINAGAWKPDHIRVNKFLQRLSGADAELATRWSTLSSFSHPTADAAKNSAAIAIAWAAPGKGRMESYDAKMLFKMNDYLVSVGTLIVAATVDAPGWIQLGCDDARMPSVEPFRLGAAALLSGHR